MLSFAFVQSREMEKKHVHIQKYVEIDKRIITTLTLRKNFNSISYSIYVEEGSNSLNLYLYVCADIFGDV